MLWPARLVCRTLRARACGKPLHPALNPHLCRALATLPAPELSLREWRRRQKVVVVTGPTAVGKTAVSLALAELLDGEVISADSVQVYKGLDVGSDKVDLLLFFLQFLYLAVAGHSLVLLSLHLGGRQGVYSCRASQCINRSFHLGVPQVPVAERRGIPHHLIDVLEPHQDFSAGDFYDLARPITDDILQVPPCSCVQLSAA